MPRQRPTIELQEHGQVLYRRKDFTKALDLFNQAISQETSPSPTLLDNRAATYEKLEDIKSALKDARTAIKIYERDVTGYLRAGKLLQKMEKPELALGIYKYGIKKKAKNVELLQKMHDKISKRLSPPIAADPFAQLPIELVEMIIAYLDFRQIVRCTSVSKQWRVFINSLPKLWADINLIDARRSVKSAFVSHCINASKHQVSSATLKGLGMNNKAVTALARTCHNLRTLKVLDGGLVSPDIVPQLQPATNLSCLVLGPGAPLSLDMVTQLLSGLPTLTELECYHVQYRNDSTTASWKGEYPSLRRLKLVNGTTHSSPHMQIPQLVLRSPNLRSLCLVNWRSLDSTMHLDQLNHLEELDISLCVLTEGALPKPGLPRSIRCLCVASMCHRPPTPGTNKYFLPALEEVRCISLDQAATLLSTEETFPQSPQNGIDHVQKEPVCFLRTLRLAPDQQGWRDVDITLDSILALPRLERVQDIGLRRAKSVNDNVADVLATRFKHLRHVDLSQTAVTGYGVKQLVQKLKATLQELVLNDCSDVSPDAIEWARSQGVKVSCFSYNSLTHGTGRKIRY